MSLIARNNFFAGLLLAVGPRPDPGSDEWTVWARTVEAKMMDVPEGVSFFHPTSSTPWRLRRDEFESWLREQAHGRHM